MRGRPRVMATQQTGIADPAKAGNGLSVEPSHLRFCLGAAWAAFTPTDISTEASVEIGARLLADQHQGAVQRLDLIAESNWVSDLGLEGGDAGGRLVVAGAPELLIGNSTHTRRA